MKISNETKIGALTAIGITVLILGFNFLKGRSLFEKRDKIYAEFPSIEGLSVSNPVLINGLQVGAVSALREKDANLSGIIVEINLTKDINIPDNSVATINPSLGGLGTTTINITRGNSTNYLKNGDHISVLPKAGVVEEVRKKLAPTLERVNDVMDSVKLTFSSLNSTLDPAMQTHLKQTMANLAASTDHLQQLLDSRNGALSNSLKNVEKITDNLAGNSDKINNVLTNVEKTSQDIADADIAQTMTSLQNSVNSLNATIAKLNSNEGTAGLLINDEQLYRHLENSARSLNILLDDLRTHPKRYVSLSVFGRKDRSGGLKEPLPVPPKTESAPTLISDTATTK